MPTCASAPTQQNLRTIDVLRNTHNTIIVTPTKRMNELLSVRPSTRSKSVHKSFFEDEWEPDTIEVRQRKMNNFLCNLRNKKRREVLIHGTQSDYVNGIFRGKPLGGLYRIGLTKYLQKKILEKQSKETHELNMSNNGPSTLSSRLDTLKFQIEEDEMKRKQRIKKRFQKGKILGTKALLEKAKTHEDVIYFSSRLNTPQNNNENMTDEDTVVSSSYNLSNVSSRISSKHNSPVVTSKKTLRGMRNDPSTKIRGKLSKQKKRAELKNELLHLELMRETMRILQPDEQIRNRPMHTTNVLHQSNENLNTILSKRTTEHVPKTCKRIKNFPLCSKILSTGLVGVIPREKEHHKVAAKLKRNLFLNQDRNTFPLELKHRPYISARERERMSKQYSQYPTHVRRQLLKKK